MMQRVLSAKFDLPQNMTDECKDLLTQIFNVDPKNRITVSGIYHHPWFLHDLSPSVPLGPTQPGTDGGRRRGGFSASTPSTPSSMLPASPRSRHRVRGGYDEIDGDGIDDGQLSR